MVVVEIFVPSIGKTYDFKLNEDIALPIIIDEITSVICQKEQCNTNGKKNNYILVKKDKEQILEANMSLFENGVSTGDILMLL